MYRRRIRIILRYLRKLSGKNRIILQIRIEFYWTILKNTWSAMRLSPSLKINVEIAKNIL
jgi:hypothetical protein